MNLRLTILPMLLMGCYAVHEPVPVNDCDPWEGVERDASGEIVHGVTQCAICRQFKDAYNARAAVLGCGAPYPLDGCPIDEGLDDCSIWQIAESVYSYGAIPDCETLLEVAGRIESFGGIECGDTCTWSDPYANPVHSDVEQPPTTPISGGWGDRYACCPGTPYEAREFDRHLFCDGS